MTAPAASAASRKRTTRVCQPPFRYATPPRNAEFDRGARSPTPRVPAISAPPDLPSKTPTRPQLLLNTAALDRLGAPEIYLRPEKRGFKIPIHHHDLSPRVKVTPEDVVKLLDFGLAKAFSRRIPGALGCGELAHADARANAARRDPWDSRLHEP